MVRRQQSVLTELSHLTHHAMRYNSQHYDLESENTPPETHLNASEPLLRSTSLKDVGPLLGYDWISSMLDTRIPIESLSDQFFEELAAFRRAHRDECEAAATSALFTSHALAMSTRTPVLPVPVQLDERLFPVTTAANGSVTLVTVPARLAHATRAPHTQSTAPPRHTAVPHPRRAVPGNPPEQSTAARTASRTTRPPGDSRVLGRRPPGTRRADTK